MACSTVLTKRSLFYLRRSVAFLTAVIIILGLVLPIGRGDFFDECVYSPDSSNPPWVWLFQPATYYWVHYFLDVFIPVPMFIAYLITTIDVPYGFAYAVFTILHSMIVPLIPVACAAVDYDFSYNLFILGTGLPGIVSATLAVAMISARLRILEQTMSRRLLPGGQTGLVRCLPVQGQFLLTCMLDMVVLNIFPPGHRTASSLVLFALPGILRLGIFLWITLGYCKALQALRHTLGKVAGTSVEEDAQKAHAEIGWFLAGVVAAFGTQTIGDITDVAGKYGLNPNLGHLYFNTWGLGQRINFYFNYFMFFVFARMINMLRAPKVAFHWPTAAKRQVRRLKASRSGLLDGNEEMDSWQEKVHELSGRGFTLRELLKFWRGLGKEYMMHFDPSAHKTSDVVRAAIIPLSAGKRCSYAEIMMDGKHTVPEIMVTHGWGNKFRDLCAAIFAAALNLGECSATAVLLELDTDTLEKLLRDAGVLDVTIWVCAFSVNQHAGICGGNPMKDVDPVTKKEHEVCSCGLPKFFNATEPVRADGASIGCEMNKFDGMIGLLARSSRFQQVVAIDRSFNVFTRAWCVAEIVQAHAFGMSQKFIFTSRQDVVQNEEKLRKLRVEDMEATRPEDVEEILLKIPDKAKFNQDVQDLLFDQETGIITEWHNMDICHRLKRAGELVHWNESTSHILKFWARFAELVGQAEEAQAAAQVPPPERTSGAGPLCEAANNTSL